jgi:ribonuclease P protein component
MIEKQRRIRRAQIPRSFTKRSIFRGKSIVVHGLAEEITPKARLSVSISKRTAKSAVDRNRLKRVIYEALRRRSDDIDCIYPYPLFVSCVRPYDENIIQDIHEDIRHFLGDSE